MAWYWKKSLKGKDDDDSSWAKYDDEVSAKIETAFQKGQKTIQVDETYSINFSDLIQFQRDDKDKQRPVKRVEVEGSEKKDKGEKRKAEYVIVLIIQRYVNCWYS